jgi:formamidopyrimidine-DNA glycosylase
MPELPEVETVKSGLASAIEGQVLSDVECRVGKLRWPVPEGFADRLRGRRLLRLSRRAKYILGHFDDQTVLLLHLGMSGRMTITDHRPALLQKHDHIIFTSANGKVVCFNDARRFGSVHLATTDSINSHPLIAGLGPEPLGNAFSGPVLAAALKGRKTAIKPTLLNQKLLAGVGNIYASEALFRAGISPRRMANSVSGQRAERLAQAIRHVLEDAIAAGGSSLRDHVQPSGELGYFQHAFNVYDRAGEPCPNAGCGRPLQRLVQTGRATFFCSNCQR